MINDFYMEQKVFLKISRDKYVRFQNAELFHKRIDFVSKFLGTINGRVLDVGNLGDGDGFMNARPIVEAAGGEYFGLDVNENLAKKMGATNQFIGDLHDLRGVVDSSSFDAIYAGEVIEHSWQPGKIILECSRILKDGGMLLMDTPNVYDLRSVVQVLFQRKNTLGDVQELTLEETKDNYQSYRNEQYQIESQPQHKIFYSPASMRQLLNMHGFKLEKIVYIDKASNPIHKLFVYFFPSSAQKIGVVARKCSSVEKIFSEHQFGDLS